MVLSKKKKGEGLVISRRDTEASVAVVETGEWRWRGISQLVGFVSVWYGGVLGDDVWNQRVES